jgi:hypothetical protein
MGTTMVVCKRRGVKRGERAQVVILKQVNNRQNTELLVVLPSEKYTRLEVLTASA